MELIDALRREHELIERVLGSFRTWADRLVEGAAGLEERERFLTFFEIYAGAFHHEREEEVLIPLLVQQAGLPGDRGPISVLTDDHQKMAVILGLIRRETDPRSVREHVVAYSHALWLHIDVENSVLLPESEIQLRRNGVYEIGSREPHQTERTAAETGQALIEEYPPIEPDIIRGDGCVMCHAYGDGCRGLEREWWNDWEWEEMSEHVAAS